MKKDDITLDDWNPNFDDGAPTVWSAEWVAPEDKLEEEQLQHEYMMMTYNGERTFRWHFPEVLEAVQSGVDVILEKYEITDVTDDDKEELLEFLRHYLWIVSMDSQYRPPMTFDIDDVEEEIGDDILGEIDSEYRTLGKESDLTSEIKRKYH